MSEKTPVVSTPNPIPEDPNVPKAAALKDDEDAEALLNEYTHLEQSEKDDKAKVAEGSDGKVPEVVAEAGKAAEDKVVAEAAKEKEIIVKPEPIDSDKVVAVGGVVDLTEEVEEKDEDVQMEGINQVTEAPGKSGFLSFLFDLLMISFYFEWFFKLLLPSSPTLPKPS
jgi:hypothetical protein